MQINYVKILLPAFFYCLFGWCISTPVQAQRVVAIFDFDGESCGDYDDANEDVMLFRDVFGHEEDGGWERFTYDEIDSAAEFLEGTCLLYIEGLCDTTTFQNFYDTYRDNIENYVELGGKLQVNTVTAERYYIGFDSIYISKHASGVSYVYTKYQSIVRAPFYVNLEKEFSATDYHDFAWSSVTGFGFDTLTLDTTLHSLGGIPFDDRVTLGLKYWSQGQVIISAFFIHEDWEDLRLDYRNLRRNILYYLSGCVRGTQNAGIYHLLSPTPECNLTNAEELRVMVYNYGYDTIYNIEACYRIEGGTTTCELFPITLPPQGFDTLVFTTPADLSLCGYNTIEAWTHIPGDSDLSNDTLSWELRNICALITDSGIPDTVCITAPVIQAHPQAGQGTWSGVGIVDEELGLFDPALVGDDNYTVITYTYNMPIDYNMYPIDFEMPELEDPNYLEMEDLDIEEVAFGFRFQYFNQQFENGYLSSDGFINLNDTVYDSSPATNEYPNMVAFCGSNLMPNISGETKIETQGDAPNRRFIIHFDDVYTWLVPGQTMNVAAILYEQDGTIEFQVDKIPALLSPGLAFWMYINNEDYTLAYNTAGTNDLSFNKWSDGANDTAFRFEPILCSRTITDTIFVTGNVSVPVLGNDTTFCPGGELTIGTNYPGTGHLWNTGDTTSHITITEGGTYTLQLHYGPGDCWLYDTITVTAEEQDLYEDVLGTDTTLCSGDSLTIELPEGYLSYAWGSGTTDSSLVITETEVIALELEYQSGCSLYDTLSVNIREPIEVTFEVTPSPDSGPGGNIIVLPSNGTPPYTIVWNDAFLSGDTIIGTWPGTYILTVTDANGCSVVDTVMVPIGTYLSNEAQSILVYPNPFNDMLSIYTDIREGHLSVYDMNGSAVLSKTQFSENITLSTALWPAGMYMMKLEGSDFFRMFLIVRN